MLLKNIAVMGMWLFSLSAVAQIGVDASHKFLIEKKTGQPFFWLGDTGWELFHRLKREDITAYLDARKAQGFNVIQAVALAELNGIRQPNRYGDVPLIKEDPAQWKVTPGADPGNAEQYDYWDHVDFAIKEAAKRKLYIGLLPTWGDKVSGMWGDGPMIFTEASAYNYAKKLAQRYKDQWNIIWILGGDRPAVHEKDGVTIDDRHIWNAMAKALKEVCGKDVFITYHPNGGTEGSAAWFQQASWLSMNAIQSGHGSREYPVWDIIRRDLQRTLLKPVMDMEPCYEDHPVNPWDGKWTRSGRGYFTPAEVRARMYRGVFAGSCGVTYGHHSVWQFLDTTLNPAIYTGDTAIHWRKALAAPVAGQVHYLKHLMLSHKNQNREEDSLLVASARGHDYKDIIIATRGDDHRYALIYLPEPRPVTVNMERLKPGKKTVRWFNPASGNYTRATASKEALQTFTPPLPQQPDWVLVIDVIEP